MYTRYRVSCLGYRKKANITVSSTNNKEEKGINDNLTLRPSLTHFHKKRQTEVDKNSSKCKAAPWDWTFAIWKPFTFFIHVIFQK